MENKKSCREFYVFFSLDEKSMIKGKTLKRNLFLKYCGIRNHQWVYQIKYKSLGVKFFIQQNLFLIHLPQLTNKIDRI